MSDAALHTLSAVEIARRIAAREVSAVEVARDALDRISATEAVLQAWVYVDREAVLGEADALDRRGRERGAFGPLAGVPVGVKDIYDIAGIPTRAGSRVLAGAPPAERDCALVARLRVAGALILGKTATTEFAAIDPAATRNPWNPAHTPGGSSSGSAAAVAARVVPVALGSQTAGSVLRPASFCGVVGFKPSYGRVSLNGVIPYAWSLDTAGWLTRSVADAAALFRAAVGAGGGYNGQPPSAPALGYMPSIFPSLQHPAMRAALADAARCCERAGATVVETEPPEGFDTILDVQQIVMAAEAAAYHGARRTANPDLYGPRLRAQVAAGLTLPAAAYVQAQRVRADLRRRVMPLLDHCDALLVPAAAGPAQAGLGSTGDPSFNAPWTQLGLPAIALPAARDEAGLPLGIQLAGQAGGDEALLRVAIWCEQALGLGPSPPAYA